MSPGYTRSVRTLEAVPGSPRRAGIARVVRSFSPGAIVLALALPVLNVRYRAAVPLAWGAELKLQDIAVVASLLAAAVVVRREGLARLRGAGAIWLTLGFLLAWIVAATFYPLLSHRPYDWRTHLVTAVAYVEYALLAPALPLLLRRRADWLLALGSLVAWSVVSSTLGVLQWAGWRVLGGGRPGYRQVSFTDQHDFTALSGAVLVIGLAVYVSRKRDARLRLAALVAVVSGEVGFIIGGASAGVIGLLPGVLVLLLVAHRRRVLTRRTLAGTIAAALVASGGVLVMRAGDFNHFLGFLGVNRQTANSHVETYSQRTLLAYIGLRIWLHHPIVGAGWYASTERDVVARELPAARRRFPGVAAQAFPGPGHQYGVQLLYVQALSDLGILGFLALVGALATPLLLGLRGALRAAAATSQVAVLGVMLLLLALGLFTGLGFVAGIPSDAVLWIAIGTIASAVSHWRRDAMMWQL
jgi:hypothetical protein